MDEEEKISQIRKVTFWGMAINLFLAGVKFAVGILGSSSAVIADAFHSLSDLATDFAVIFGVKFWSAPPDENHPYGHSKIESFVTLFIGLSLAAVALGISYEALTAIQSNKMNKISWIAIIGPAWSVLLKEIIYHWTNNIGKEIKSSAVIANAWHHRSDAISSIPTLIAVLVASIYPGFEFVDQIGAIVVSLFILRVSWGILKPALQELSDSGIHLERINEIKDTVLSIQGVEDTHAIRTRKSGSSIYVDLHVLVDPNMTVHEGHEISKDVKYKILECNEDIVDVVIHLEPDDEHKLKYEKK